MTSYCAGAREVIIEYTHTEPDKVGAAGTVYCANNGGNLTYEWVENLQFRRYFDVGYYGNGDDRGCGEEYGYICSGYKLDSLGLEFEEVNNGWAIPVSPDSPGVYAFAVGYQKDVVDLLLETRDLTDPRFAARGLDFTPRLPPSPTVGGALYRMSSCSRNYPSSRRPALGINSRDTFRWGNPSKWYLSIKENGQEIHQYGSPDAGFDGTGNPGFNPPNRTITYQPSTTFNRRYTIRKTSLASEIRASTEPFNGIRYSSSDPRFYLGAPRLRLNFEEYLNDEETGIGILADVLSGGVPIPADIRVTCVGACPPDTCAVDCGTHYCCYGSDGIARDSFPK